MTNEIPEGYEAVTTDELCSCEGCAFVNRRKTPCPGDEDSNALFPDLVCVALTEELGVTNIIFKKRKETYDTRTMENDDA